MMHCRQVVDEAAVERRQVGGVHAGQAPHAGVAARVSMRLAAPVVAEAGEVTKTLTAMVRPLLLAEAA